MISSLRSALVLFLALLCTVTPVEAGADFSAGSGEDHLSPYWGGAISQWSRWILLWSEERELDPDLVAAIIRKESIGHASAEGPYGAVGLMMVMPAETSGLSWRPSTEELKQPSLNIRWGTGMLREIIRESGGDLLSALAAYNGGWDQLHLPTTEYYAHSVLSYYAHAIAARNGYSHQESKDWTLVLMTRMDHRIKLMQSVTSGDFLVPCFEGAVAFRQIFPDMATAPRTRVAHFTDDAGHDYLIDAWLFVGDQNKPESETLVSAGPPPPPRTGHRP